MKLTLPIIIALALSGCTAHPPQTLDEKLAGLSSDERKEILRLACLNEAMQVGNGPHKHQVTLPGKQSFDDTVQTDHFQHICREMNENYPNKK